MGLLPLDEVERRLRIRGQSWGGVAAIPVERVVGSVDRGADFGPGFTPRHGFSRRRIDELARAFPDGAFPPIEVYEVGGLYFVADGHHRIALARRLGVEYIDAAVTRLHADRELPPDVDVGRLVHTHQQRLLMESSGLGRTRPEAWGRIVFARPRGYPEMLEVIKAHGFDMARRRGAVPSLEEVAADWYDGVYLAAAAAAERAGLAARYPVKTEADIVLWLHERRRDLRAFDEGADWDAAAAVVAREGLGRRDRRVIEREAADPLPGPPGATTG